MTKRSRWQQSQEQKKCMSPWTVLCRAVPPQPHHPIPPHQSTAQLHRAKKEKGDDQKKLEKRKELKSKQAQARQRQGLLLRPLFLTSQFTQDSLARQLFPLVPPPFRADPSLSPKASSFSNCLVTSGIKEYVLALCMIDSLIHPSILFPWHFAAPGLCAWPLRGEDFGLFFLFLGVQISGEIFV